MIIAYHAIFTTYGTWLPNDPRGSFSKEIYNEEIKALGTIRYGRQYPQPARGELRYFWTAVAPKLSRRPFFLDDNARSSVGKSFGTVVKRLNLRVRACAIMNDHIHILIMRTKHRIEYLVGQFKGAATRALRFRETPWTRGSWKVFINDQEALYAAASYIEQNPIRARWRPQRWDFVTPLPPKCV